MCMYSTAQYLATIHSNLLHLVETRRNTHFLCAHTRCRRITGPIFFFSAPLDATAESKSGRSSRSVRGWMREEPARCKVLKTLLHKKMLFEAPGGKRPLSMKTHLLPHNLKSLKGRCQMAVILAQSSRFVIVAKRSEETTHAPAVVAKSIKTVAPAPRVRPPAD